MDLITNPEEIASTSGTASQRESVEEDVGADERLDGETVRAIWKLSRLERATLRVIWSVVPACSLGVRTNAMIVHGAGWSVILRARVLLTETAS